MQIKDVKRGCIIIVCLLSLVLLVGCAGQEFAPKDPYMYWYYPSELPQADRAVAEARAAGKDKECPAEFKAAEDLKNKAYELYAACRDQEAIDTAKEATKKAKALCPAKPAPAPAMKPAPAPVPPAVAPAAAKAAPVAIALEDINFDFDKATITDAAKKILDRDVKVLKDNPGIKVRIEGHACQHGADDYNMRLSERRANAVKEYLVKEGIAADRLTTIAYGKTRPLFDEKPTAKNKNSAGMKANRRAHFEIMK